MENFREISTPMYPQAATDDAIDWLQRHADKMNEMFATAGSLKRVHYDVLETLQDGDDLPALRALVEVGLRGARELVARVATGLQHT
jgi:hypothetical protein